ncbi:hypothetical protein [Actinoplanes solisilvae]|uniref:hypothetical protein n=1 Tax=Actinoplanes solisilvae TaxID=2486853 RepID=UPI0013E372E0|nr:hypothetical protein [Actinoplanes solisilvae]
MTRKNLIAFAVSATFPLFGLAATVAGAAVVSYAGIVSIAHRRHHGRPAAFAAPAVRL